MHSISNQPSGQIFVVHYVITSFISSILVKKKLSIIVSVTIQGLIHREKELIDCEKGARINVVANKIVTMMSQISLRSLNKLYIKFILYFLVIMFKLFCWLDQKTGNVFTVVSVLLKIRFGQAQIIVPKIGIPMSKTACINPCHSKIHFKCVRSPAFSSFYELLF